MKGLLRRIVQELRPERVSVTSYQPLRRGLEDQSQQEAITHAWLWPRITQFLRTGDIVLTETGTVNFGILDTKLPDNSLALSQVLWGSVGWALGACQGAVLAARDAGTEQNRRTILFIGDGSFQFTVQELSTLIRRELKPIMLAVVAVEGPGLSIFANT